MVGGFQQPARGGQDPHGLGILGDEAADVPGLEAAVRIGRASPERINKSI